MKDIKQLVKEWNERKILQAHGDWIEDLPNDIWGEYFEYKYEILKDNIDPEKHRWYQTSIVALKMPNAIIGIRFIDTLFSESSYYEDCYHHLEFFVMEEITAVTYKPID